MVLRRWVGVVKTILVWVRGAKGWSKACCGCRREVPRRLACRLIVIIRVVPRLKFLPSWSQHFGGGFVLGDGGELVHTARRAASKMRAHCGKRAIYKE